MMCRAPGSSLTLGTVLWRRKVALMELTHLQKCSAHFFAGWGGDICGLIQANWRPQLAIEINTHRCRTLRQNHPGLQGFEVPIQMLTLADYPPDPIPFYFLTFPCDHY